MSIVVRCRLSQSLSHRLSNGQPDSRTRRTRIDLQGSVNRVDGRLDGLRVAVSVTVQCGATGKAEAVTENMPGSCPGKGVGEQDRLTACNPCQHYPPVCKAANPPQVSVRILDPFDSMFSMEGTAEGS